MPRKRYRTHSLRRVYVRTPGGEIVIHYEKRPWGTPRCALCKRPLFGVPRDSRKLKDLPKTKKRPERPYGGYLCAECLRRELTLAILDKYAGELG